MHPIMTTTTRQKLRTEFYQLITYFRQVIVICICNGKTQLNYRKLFAKKYEKNV